ncbi:hypothetical protein Gorai_024760, partial [Gossypium raimondii]|nr:hypothetical protein [Gossypium raimondii]
RLTWKLQTLPKIRIFCWGLGHDILPTYEKIYGIWREINSTCPRCGIKKETLLHTMKNCPKAQAVLVYGGLNNNLIEGSYGREIDVPKTSCGESLEEARTGVVTINFDAIANGKNISFGLVARDHDGFVLGGRAGVMDKNVQAEWAEVHELEESISFARTKNWLKLQFESNCVNLVNRLNRTKADFSTMGY